MIRLIILLCLMMATVCRSFSSEARIVVDLEHSQVAQEDGKDAPFYRISVCDSLLVDATRFDFKKSLYPDEYANVVQLLIGNDRQYWADWSEKNSTILSRATLKPMRSDVPGFDGLKSGDKVAVLIGWQHLDTEKKKPVMKLLWLGLVEVP